MLGFQSHQLVQVLLRQRQWPSVLQRSQLLLRETRGLFQRLQTGSHLLAAKIQACGRLQPMLQLL